MRALQGRASAGATSSSSSRFSRPHATRHALAPTQQSRQQLGLRQSQQCRAAAEEAAGTNGANAPADSVDFEELSDIIRMVNDTDIIELELNSKKFNLSLRKKEALVMEQQRQQMQSPAPGEPPFCKEGDKVTKGQTVGIIEAMKLMNEIEAEVSGTLVRVLADNGSPVAPGMALFLIKP
ncbi:hypothetical protein DUNSADRAFT_13871 [Dunaliella salina]|uniref:Biotin carboxyl carrier protein of acetyl-CoA carboxylase n=1 Tax=Dunaliella salina TaxID=3046 RepID=A0ABQ7H2Z7_DUNSA|nr:hypothetical protein DUNSADRAFT_13871 [Dunaliella salina]|eukprot:KAF5841226.1 hypothetical protein DUNSADRAFT_13871 [Dunaliella salina]